MILYSSEESVKDFNEGGWIITATTIPFRNMTVPFETDDQCKILPMDIPTLFHVSKPQKKK